MQSAKMAEEITVAVLTVSDRCAKNETEDKSGPALVKMIEFGAIKNARVVQRELVADHENLIAVQIKKWCDEENIDIVLTTGGTGLDPRDVTPEATRPLLEKLVTGIPQLMLKRSLEVTPFAALSRALAGIRGKSLIVNLPGSKKAATECLDAIASILPHAVDLISGREEKVRASHGTLSSSRKSSVRTDVIKPNKSPFPCVALSDAQKIVVDRIFLLKKECTVRLEDATDFVLAEDVIAKNFLPPFDTSLKDGYAVVDNCSNTLKIIGCSHAGSLPGPDLVVKPSTCVTISTGAPLPAGANAVIPVENTDPLLNSEIRVRQIPRPFSEVRLKGSDFKPGSLLLNRGFHLDSGGMGLMAAANIALVKVFAKPTVAVISTGNELVNPGSGNLVPGKICDSNRVTLISMLKREGFPFVDLGIVSDEPNALCNVLDEAFKKADVVVTSGGMSMGQRDYLKEVLEKDFAAEICFGRILIKPGKPTAFAIVPFEGMTKLWFGLPGNPASAAVTAHLLVLPALRKISGQTNVFPEVLMAQIELSESFQLDDERPEYLRGMLSFAGSDHHYKAKITGAQNSSRIASCAGADCLIEIPRSFYSNTGKNQIYKNTHLNPNDWVRVFRIGKF